MSDTTTTRFRMKKTVGSPSVDGASGIETLASHTNNPSAHPDYMKKGALPAYFSGSEHLTDKLAHCAYYARRSEVMTSKLDYEQTKNMSLTNDASNYAATSGVKRYILTSYVLNLILAANGFDGSKTYIETNKIVTSMGTVPVGYEAHYVIGYPLFKNLYDLVSVINANYLTVAVANSLYSAIDHVHEVTEVRGAMNVLGYSYTEDTTFQSGKTYYTYSNTSHAMVAATVTPGDPVGVNTYFEKDSEKYSSGSHTHSIFDVKGGVTVIGYARTPDTVPVAGKTYYKYNAASDVMEVSTDTTFITGTVYFERQIKTDDLNCLEYTISLATAPAAGSVTTVGSIPSRLDIAKLGFEVVLMGTKTVDSVTSTYTWINPMVEIADPTGHSYVPIYVNSQSLISCSKSGSSNATLKFTHPYSWLDTARVAGTNPGIQDMDSLTLKIRVIKRIISA